MFRKLSAVLAVILLGILLSVSNVRAYQLNTPHFKPLAAPIGTGFLYQGYLKDGSSPAEGSYDFEFSLYDDPIAGSLVGGPAPVEDVSVSDGYFTVELDFGAVFDGTALWLEIGVRPGIETGGYTTLSPRQPMSPAPYAIYASIAPWSGVSGMPADFADGVDDDTTYSAGEGLTLVGDVFHAQGSPFANVVIVAQDGGDFTSIQAAIDSITDAAAANPYLVWVAPGEYSEMITMKSHVHLQGAGQEATIVTSAASSGSFPPSQATLTLASDVSLRDLTVENTGTGSTDHNVALMASGGMTRSLIVDVTARAEGAGDYNYAIVLSGSGTSVRLEQVTVLSENGSFENFGLYNCDGASSTLRSGSFTGRGGANSYGIRNVGSGTTLEAEGISALGENASESNFALYNLDGAAARLHSGSFTGRGGNSGYGIHNFGSGTSLEAESVIALGEDGWGNGYGLYNALGAVATLYSGSFTGRGDNRSYGIQNNASGTTLDAMSITALGENGSNENFGLRNGSGAAATLRSGSFTGRGGSFGYGIYNSESGTTLEATSCTAMGEGAASSNYGLYQGGGTVSLGVTQLIAGVNKAGGDLSCFQVYDGTFHGLTCP